MLKRQRAVSPPPSTPSVPLISDPSPMDLTHHRDSKRRRVLPPVLDGDARGWAKPAYDDGEEEYESDEDIERQQDAHRNAVDAQSLSPYKSANSFLHDLHTLQRHRLMFALPMPLSTQAPQYQQYTDYQKNNYPQSPSKEFHHSLASYAAHDHVPMGKSILPLISERPRSPEKMASPGSGQELGDIGDSMSVDEVQRVTERYEDTNKLLGSLFLSRRRELGSGSGSSSGSGRP